MIVRMCGDHHAADDVCQEAYYLALKNRGSFRNHCAVSTWITRIALNAHFSSRRRKNHARPFSSSAAPEWLLDHALWRSRETAEGLEDVLAQEARQQVLAVLAALTPPHRRILELRHFDLLTYEVIAQLEHIEVGTVRSRLARARDAFRHQYLRYAIGRALRAEVEGDVRASVP